MGINLEAVESLSIEILNKKCKNIILNEIYRPLDGDENYFNNLFAKNDTVNEHIVLAGDFYLNVLDFENNKKVRNFINLMFRYDIISTINKPTRSTANTATAIDHIITNLLIDTDFKTRILKKCISDRFFIMLVFQVGQKKMSTKSEQHINKRTFDETSIVSFRLRLLEIKWDNFKTYSDSNLAYNELLDTFTSLYDDCFPRVKIKVKARHCFRA